MDNYFLLRPPYASAKRGRIVNFANKVLKRLKLHYRLQQELDVTVDMNSTEQRINYFLLLDAVLAYHVQGDVVELGCFTGQCALLFQKTMQQRQSNKTLHLFDSFEHQFAFKGNVQTELLNRFKQERLPLPVLHKGYFEDTLPKELPSQIAFVHIDCGFGGDAETHKRVMLHCLNSIYGRLTIGAVCVLMDYHDGKTGMDLNPGVKLACDEFFNDKPEQVVSLYGNQYAHGYFRKL